MKPTNSNDVKIYIPLEEPTNPTKETIPKSDANTANQKEKKETPTQKPFIIYIKYIDNSQKSIEINNILDENVKELQKLAFPDKYNDETLTIRLIYQGRLLKNDEIIKSLNLQNEGFIHGVINEKIEQPQPQTINENLPTSVNPVIADENSNDNRALQLVNLLIEAQRQNDLPSENNGISVRLNRENGKGVFIMGVLFGYFSHVWAIVIMYLCNFPEKAKSGVLLGFCFYILVRAMDKFI